MAVVTSKSTLITNRDATPVVLNNEILGGGRLKEAVGYVSAVSGDSIASKYIIAQVPSNARVSQILLYSEALSTGATTDCGVYRTTADGGAVVSQAFFASAVDVSGAVNGTDITNESGTNTLDKRQQALWQAAGLATDPCSMLDIALTLTAAAAANGKIGLIVRYV